MSDEYTWNNPNSIAHHAIDGFLSVARLRIDSAPDALPFKAMEGRLVLAWLRALMRRTPSQLGAE